MNKHQEINTLKLELDRKMMDVYLYYKSLPNVKL